MNQCSYLKETKTIIVGASWRSADTQDAQRLSWSELTFQRWNEIAGDATKDLKYVIRQYVTNQGTKATMKLAHEKLNFDLNKEGIFYPSDRGSDMDKAFQALAGTDNAKGVFYMLGDHHEAFGDLKVVRIHTWPTQTIGKDAHNPSMILEMGH